MNIHEYQAKEILRKYGVPTPRGLPCFSVEDAVLAADRLGGEAWVVKAQIHAGGRGKAGGVKLAKSIDEVRQHASNMLGMTLVTHQTGPEGRLVKRLLVEEGADIRQELYVGMVVDRQATSAASSTARAWPWPRWTRRARTKGKERRSWRSRACRSSRRTTWRKRPKRSWRRRRGNEMSILVDKHTLVITQASN